ncbi:MAG: hypothetical protein ACR2LR_06015 [Hassallia sp.]
MSSEQLAAIKSLKNIPEGLRFYLYELLNFCDLRDEYLITKIGGFYYHYRTIVLCKFAKEEYKLTIHLPKYQIRKHDSKDFKKQFDFEVKLQQQTLKLLFLLVQDHQIDAYHYWRELFIECRIAMFFISTENNSFTTTQYFQKLQKENSEMFQDLADDDINHNPFDKLKSPYTTDFIKICLEQAAKNNTFELEYLKLGKIRMEFVSFLRKEKPFIYSNDTDKLEWRGR